ncbi:hypothetical protein JG687_00010392 [Phytophthora cactorum]|uniref:Uncharacterized protein n=1 Tax=Phytophthora cactorum TaxID=29920 RepID=A0A8T1UA41_9STRA|nr:hypothetical protein JG687_00010392 [Phytophthora cactorum]
MRGAKSTQIQVLDGPALRALSTELNSSKYAIDAHNRSIGEIGNLSELPKLCSLDVSFNKITSLRNVSTARELRELKIYNNKLNNTLGLKANSNLEGLQMNDNRIEEISSDFLALGRLKNLWLNSNKISSVRNLRGCRLLVHLDLGRNKLQGAASEGLDALNNLEYLNLSGNQLISVGNLTHLTKLEELNLSENKLTTLQGVMPPNLATERIPRIVHRARTVQSLLIRRSCVDAGTDPLESLMSNNKPVDIQMPAPGCEMETQTSLPPAPVLSVSKSGSIGGLESNFTPAVEEQHEQNNEASSSPKEKYQETEKSESPWEPQQDSDAIEAEMKQFLMQHVMDSTGNNQNRVEEKPEMDVDPANFWSDSPRLDIVKTAELRMPPTSLSRAGYRSFRMPARPSSSNSS